MRNTNIPKLYKQYFIDKQDERRMLFEIIANRFKPVKGLYPGSFTHITPSLYIQNMTYIDSDRRIARFFQDPHVKAYLEYHKTYDEALCLHGIQGNFTKSLNLPEKDYDVMFSFYSGLISQHCKQYLKEGGILVCNNSHGDSSIAFTDKDYQLIGVINRRGDKFTISEKNLEVYFQKKDGTIIDCEKVKRKLTGENFSKKAFAYIFRYSEGEA